MHEHSPATALRFPAAAMRDLRERVSSDNPQLAHDLGALRRLTLKHALRESGSDPALAEAAYAAFYDARNQVACYPAPVDALARIAARSAERRVGKEGVSTCRSRWSRYH